MKVKEFVKIVSETEESYDIWFQVNNSLVLCVASTNTNASPFIGNNFYMLCDMPIKEVIDEGEGLYLISEDSCDARLLAKCKHK